MKSTEIEVEIEEPSAMYTSTIRLANQFVHSITYVAKPTAAESAAEAMSVYYADEYTEEEFISIETTESK